MSKIGKPELLKKVSEKSGLSIKDVKVVLDSLRDVTLTELNAGVSVPFTELLTLKPEDKPATTMTNYLVKDDNGNPTKQDVPAKTVMKAILSKKYKVLK